MFICWSSQLTFKTEFPYLASVCCNRLGASLSFPGFGNVDVVVACVGLPTVLVRLALRPTVHTILLSTNCGQFCTFSKTKSRRS